MKIPNPKILMGSVAMGAGILALSACTHFDWGKNVGNDDRDAGVVDVGPSEPLERIVEYGPRPPVAKEACGTSDFVLHYAPGYTQSEDIAATVDTMVSGMSLLDKVNEMRGTNPAGGANDKDIFRQMDNQAKGIRGLLFRDGPRGLNLATDKLEGHLGQSTAFPVSMARAASFDLDLENEIGKATGEETLASKHTLLLAPTVNLLRHPGWGRAQETYGEDPFVLGRMGSAYTLGVQTYIPACVKHFIANNIENERWRVNSEMDEQTLREIYGRAYEMIIRDAGVACVMAAYNPVQGTKSTENRHILTEVLRDDFGFTGFVISDWWAMTNGDLVGLTEQNYRNVANAALLAGLDMEMPWSFNYAYLEKMVPNDASLQQYINSSVTRILHQKYRFNVGDLSSTSVGLKTPTVGWDRNTSSIINNDANLNLAERAALEGAVLLKNDNQTLPIKGVSKVAVLSATVDYPENAVAIPNVNYANDVLTGDWGSSLVFHNPDQAVSPLKGIREAAQAKGVQQVVDGTSVAVAQDADFIVVVAGLNSGDEGEEYYGAGDRSTFALDGKIDGTPQNDLINAAIGLHKPMAVVLIGGSVIDMPWLANVPAVLMAWYPGMRGGRAIGQLLFGDASPGGKLPITWPATWNDAPNFKPDANASVNMEYFAGYRYYEKQNKTPLFPFGHGLSYTTFEYLNLEVPCSTVTTDGVVKVRVDVSNRGAVAGDEVAFLFIAYPGSQDEKKSIKQLKGFYRVHLEAGQTKQILLPLRINDLRFFDTGTNTWKTEPGAVEIMVGSSADNILLTDQVTIN